MSWLDTIKAALGFPSQRLVGDIELGVYAQSDHCFGAHVLETVVGRGNPSTPVASLSAYVNDDGNLTGSFLYYDSEIELIDESSMRMLTILNIAVGIVKQQFGKDLVSMYLASLLSTPLTETSPLAAGHLKIDGEFKQNGSGRYTLCWLSEEMHRDHNSSPGDYRPIAVLDIVRDDRIQEGEKLYGTLMVFDYLANDEFIPVKAALTHITNEIGLAEFAGFQTFEARNMSGCSISRDDE